MNNGVLLLIAKDDRAFRIEVGYGLEGAITDDYAGSVLDAMTPAFRNENYSAELAGLGAALGIPAKPAHLGSVADFGDLLLPEDAT